MLKSTYRIGPEFCNGCRVELIKFLLQSQRLMLFYLIGELGEVKELTELRWIRVGEGDLDAKNEIQTGL